MTYFLDLSTIVWIVVLIAVAIVIYGFLEAERDVKRQWTKLERTFRTDKYGISWFDDPSQLANGLLKKGGAAIGVNVRIVSEGILIRGAKSSVILIPWTDVRKANSRSNGSGTICLLLRRDQQSEIEMTLPWSARFPSLE